MGCSSSQEIHGMKPYEMLLGTNFFDAYSLGPKLGEGTFAQVHVATGRDKCEMEVAVKIINLRKLSAPSCYGICGSKWKLMNRELAVWSSIERHPNIVQLQDAFFWQGMCFMVMDTCGSRLAHHLENMDHLNEQTIANIFVQMLHGISHLHKGFVVHRDIKPDNFVMASGGHTVKLCDFGLSIVLPASGKLGGLVGTPPFMCPEMAKGKGYDEKADMWSFGVLVYVLLFGAFPYTPEKEETAENVRKAIIKGKIPLFEPFCKVHIPRSQYVIAFVKALLNRHPIERPCANEALQLAYLTMAREERLMSEVCLPSLRPMVSQCRKIGALETRNLRGRWDTDDLINRLHIESHGRPIQESWPERHAARKKIRDASAFASAFDSLSTNTDCGARSNSQSSQNSDTTTWEGIGTVQSSLITL